MNENTAPLHQKIHRQSTEINRLRKQVDSLKKPKAVFLEKERLATENRTLREKLNVMIKDKEASDISIANLRTEMSILIDKSTLLTKTFNEVVADRDNAKLQCVILHNSRVKVNIKIAPWWKFWAHQSVERAY